VEWSFCSHQYAALTHLIYDGARFMCELDAEKKTGAADFADHFVTRIQFVQAGEQTVSDAKGVLLQVLFLHDFKDS
jgi:hypothetical protein